MAVAEDMNVKRDADVLRIKAGTLKETWDVYLYVVFSFD